MRCAVPSTPRLWRLVGLAILTTIVSCEPTEIRVRTEMGPDGSSTRRLLYLFPEKEDPSTGETGGARIPERLRLPDRAGWSLWELRDRTLVAEGYYLEPSSIPSAFRWQRRETSRPIGTAVTFHHDDFLLFDRWRYAERFVPPVDREAMERALQEAVDLTIGLADEALLEILGEWYDLEDAHRWLQDDGARLARSVLLLWWEDTREPDPDRLASRIAARLGRAGVRIDGETLLGEEPWQELVLAFARRIGELARPLDASGRDGRRRVAAAPEAIPQFLSIERVQQALQDAGLRRFGTEQAFEAWFEDRLADLMGEFGGPNSNDLRFDVTVHMPGELLATNGTILGPDEALWRFSSGDLFPGGRRLEASSLEMRWSALAGVSGWKGTLDRRDVLDLIDLLGGEDGSPDVDRIEALRRCLARRGPVSSVLAPLREVSEETARAMEALLTGSR